MSSYAARWCREAHGGSCSLGCGSWGGAPAECGVGLACALVGCRTPGAATVWLCSRSWSSQPACPPAGSAAHALQVAVGILEHCGELLLEMQDMEMILQHLKQDVPKWPRPVLQVGDRREQGAWARQPACPGLAVQFCSSLCLLRHAACGRSSTPSELWVLSGSAAGRRAGPAHPRAWHAVDRPPAGHTERDKWGGDSCGGSEPGKRAEPGARHRGRRRCRGLRRLHCSGGG